MADSKLADLTAITDAGGDEVVYVVDDPAGTPVDRKISVADLLKTKADATNNVSGDGSVLQVVEVTQAAYDALTPVATTLYVIVG